MLVTLFVDASFYSNTKAAAYAMYAISGRGRLNYAGVFNRPIQNSSHAELAAVANAMHILLPHTVAAGAKKILIQTDCTSVIHWLEGQNALPLYREVVEYVHARAKEYGVVIEMRHVKAHVGTGEPRLYCQDWCDRECRRLARRQNNSRLGGIDGSPVRKRRRRRKKNRAPPMGSPCTALIGKSQPGNDST